MSRKLNRKIIRKTLIKSHKTASKPFVHVIAQEGTWDYNQQDKWPGYCNTGKTQSPINIQTNRLVSRHDLAALKFSGFDKAVSTSVVNNGHSVLVKPIGNAVPKLSGGGLTGTYIFENLHFHWPAEHTIDDQSFDLEAHFVFYSDKYPNITVAIQNKDGIAVVGIFYNKSQSPCPKAFEKLASAAEKISKKVGSETVTEPITLQELLPYNSPFYNYRGSLTTPDCNEVVNWFVLKHIGKITTAQYKSLTTIYGHGNQLLTFTNRKIQPINGRHVYCNV